MNSPKAPPSLNQKLEETKELYRAYRNELVGGMTQNLSFQEMYLIVTSAQALRFAAEREMRRLAKEHNEEDK